MILVILSAMFSHARKNIRPLSYNFDVPTLLLVTSGNSLVTSSDALLCFIQKRLQRSAFRWIFEVWRWMPRSPVLKAVWSDHWKACRLYLVRSDSKTSMLLFYYQFLCLFTYFEHVPRLLSMFVGPGMSISKPAKRNRSASGNHIYIYIILYT